MSYIKISEDKAVRPVMEKPVTKYVGEYPQYTDADEAYNQHLLTLPTFEVPESMKSLPVGSELNVREQYEVYKTHFTNDGWNVCDKERYDLELPEARRIILVPCEQGEEVKDATELYRGDLQSYTDRILRDKGASNKDVHNAIDEVVTELSAKYKITRL